MSRGYPRFLYSHPKNTKDEGPFIVHTLEPKFVVRVAKLPNKEPGRMTFKGNYIIFFIDGVPHSKKLMDTTDALFKWLEAQVKDGEIEIPDRPY